MFKFLELKNGNLLNVNEIRSFTKNVYFNKQYKSDGEVSRKGVAEIIVDTRDGLQVVARAVATAPSTVNEAWETGAEKCEKAEKKVSEILDGMVDYIIDRMNVDSEYTIKVYTGLLEKVLTTEVEEA